MWSRIANVDRAYLLRRAAALGHKNCGAQSDDTLESWIAETECSQDFFRQLDHDVGTGDREMQMAWFAEASQSPDHDLLTAFEDGRKVGMIRFSKVGDSWLVAMVIAPHERGNWYGDRALRHALAEVGSRKLRAEVGADNLTSVRMFERFGFMRTGTGSGVVHVARP